MLTWLLDRNLINYFLRELKLAPITFSKKLNWNRKHDYSKQSQFPTTQVLHVFMSNMATFIFWTWAGIFKRIQEPCHIILSLKKIFKVATVVNTYAAMHRCSVFCFKKFTGKRLCPVPFFRKRSEGRQLWCKIDSSKNVKSKKTTNLANQYFVSVAFRTCFFSPFSKFNDERTKFQVLQKANHNSWQW